MRRFRSKAWFGIAIASIMATTWFGLQWVNRPRRFPATPTRPVRHARWRVVDSSAERSLGEMAQPLGEVVVIDRRGRKKQYRLCQIPGVGGSAPGARLGVVCDGAECGNPSWRSETPIPWEVFAQGEYVGPHRLAHVPEYRLRVDDELEFIYRLTRNETTIPYKLNVGDQIRLESVVDKALNRDLIIQPDGTITALMIGQVRAAGRTVEELRGELERRYSKFLKLPAITVTPLKVDTKLEDLRNAVDSRYGAGGQGQQARITPEGTVHLPAIGAVPAQGLTLEELKKEVDARYAEVVGGVEVTARLVERAPRFVYVLGEVEKPGRFRLEGPTTVMQALAMAGSWKFGGNLHQIIIFRRTEDWRLIATRLDLNGALLGRQPCPADEIWLRDSDVLMIPKGRLLLMDEYINLLFTRGLYSLFPLQSALNFNAASSL